MRRRYVRRSDKQRIAEAFALGTLDELILQSSPSYNVAPTIRQPFIVVDRDTGQRRLAIMRWGLIPFWCKAAKTLGLSTINAKAETLMEKPMWRGPFTKRRCLIPADGYYEWQKIDAKTKQPWHYAAEQRRAVRLCGLLGQVEGADGNASDSFSIITTDASELANRVHDRMPVILKPQDYARWLEPGEPERPTVDLLRLTRG
jgi:putative SOS response-associated peptidase YedK